MKRYFLLRVESGSENLLVRASSNLIIIRSSLDFHGKCVESDSRRLQMIENNILCLQNDYRSEITKSIKRKIWVRVRKFLDPMGSTFERANNVVCRVISPPIRGGSSPCRVITVSAYTNFLVYLYSILLIRTR